MTKILIGLFNGLGLLAYLTVTVLFLFIVAAALLEAASKGRYSYTERFCYIELGVLVLLGVMAIIGTTIHWIIGDAISAG